MQETVLRKKLEEINNVLRRSTPMTDDIGVLSGSAGIALFHFNYAQFIQDEESINYGVDIITSIVQNINEGYNFYTYCGGIAGAAWAIELLNELEYIDLDNDLLLEGLDPFLTHTFNIDPKQNFYDFLHGVLGIGYYFLKRYDNTQSKELKKRYEAKLITIINLLNKTAVRVNDGIYWDSFLIREEGVRGSNLSLAHGLSSIINYLSRLIDYPAFKESTMPLLEGALSYILSAQKVDYTNVSYFPDWITSTQEESRSNRLAWCYGDLGISLSLWRAGSVLKRKELSNLALTILKELAKKRGLEETRICDAGLCHGAFGVMHIFDYLYKETKELVFKEAADHWCNEGLKMDVHDQLYAGYMKWQGGDNPGWKPENGLLEGIAGIGLAIISHLEPEQMDWNQCMLIG